MTEDAKRRKMLRYYVKLSLRHPDGSFLSEFFIRCAQRWV